ncbi:hypothetical protein NDU88_000435 [Pleurodeles waltl]|uniref:Uncharacterized protein n=1 Tax=Pleurodeles waltl TaxID=8319 RepID=A0AAV7M080_PLEWA|nr:hypothetical protein NDU88_000435 [Pleurodeles waltl]
MSRGDEPPRIAKGSLQREWSALSSRLLQLTLRVTFSRSPCLQCSWPGRHGGLPVTSRGGTSGSSRTGFTLLVASDARKRWGHWRLRVLPAGSLTLWLPARLSLGPAGKDMWLRGTAGKGEPRLAIEG